MHYGINAIDSTLLQIAFLDELPSHYSAELLFVDIELAAQMEAAITSHKRFNGPISFGVLADQRELIQAV